MRIVSLLPSTTEILFGIGAGDDVVGVTFECDHPAEARSRRVVSTSTMPAGLTPAQIDEFVRAAMARGKDLYRLDAGALSALEPDLVVTQDLCAVCAVDVSVVDDALAYLGCRAEVLTVDPHTLTEVFDSVRLLGKATGRQEVANDVATSLEARVEAVRARVTGRRRPRVMLLEWTDPPFAPGHWVPEMVEAAGGEPVLGAAGAKSVRTTWDAIRASRPEVYVVAPCGFGRDAAQELADDLVANGHLPEGAAVLAVDADASWVRPGLRLVDGIEELAAFLHPDP
ncbi:cobalamin-binding protein [Humibacillus sp. DSM 29435]|uniref:cobalamin-binding protein n=1 Tax=Humibacillus sp. DSM 29435 TaxID=1869167 RepID=UPI000871D4AD|nr:cobalamin-binding protein [Humibacillus sp. DSM 29435]OFE17819.1 cobalamin-binding protein [Humibacillus sp. DSM 29435]